MICNATCVKGKWEFDASSCVQGSQLFTSNDSFTVPLGVTSMRLLLVGGGMGDPKITGYRWFEALPIGPGGAGGFVACQTVNVTAGSIIPVGSGSSPGKSGSNSSFGPYLSAAGAICNTFSFDGYSGGTGSGARYASPVTYVRICYMFEKKYFLTIAYLTLKFINCMSSFDKILVYFLSSYCIRILYNATHSIKPALKNTSIAEAYLGLTLLLNSFK